MSPATTIAILAIFLLCFLWGLLLTLRDLRDRRDGLASLGWIAAAALVFVFLSTIAAGMVAPVIDRALGN